MQEDVRRQVVIWRQEDTEFLTRIATLKKLATINRLVSTRIGKLLMVSMWMQAGYSQHGEANILLLRRNDQIHYVNVVSLGEQARVFTTEGEMLAPDLTEEEIDAMLFEVRYTIAARRLPDGRMLSVVPLTYDRARVTISSHFSPLVYDTVY